MRKKVAGIIACQILLIVSSYLILVFFDNQSAYLGNSINISGKNRYLGQLLYEKTVNYVFTDDNQSPSDIVQKIDKNIKALSQGGTVSQQNLVSKQIDIIVMPVPSKFSDDFAKLESNWSQYKDSIISMMSSKDKNILNDKDLESQNAKFIVSADQITYDLSNYSKDFVGIMTILQITLLGVNVTAHLLLLRIIFRIIIEEQTKKILLQQMSEKNKELEFERKFALLEKDISEAFIMDMKNKLHELNEQVNMMNKYKDYKINNLVIRQIFQSLFDKKRQLGQMTIELENKKSDYEQLINKLRDNIFFRSKKDKNKTKKSEDLATVIQSCIDIVNLMVHDQKLPATLGKDLTDAFSIILDNQTLKTVNKP